MRALVDGTWCNAVANLGRRPTFGKLQENFEVHLFDFAREIYGALVRVEFNGTTAREAERFDMGTRIREVEQGPDGALWLLEDGGGGRLLKLTPNRS